MQRFIGDKHLGLPQVKLENGTDTLEAVYDYDFAGARISKSVGTAQTVYVYSGPHVIAEYMDLDGGGTPNDLARRYIYGPGIDQPIAMIDFTTRTPVWYYYHQDVLGNVVALSNVNGNLVESYEYTPFGTPTMYNAAGTVITTSSVDNPYLFTGRRLDAESGLYYYRFRMYNSELGRFMQTDPIGYYDSMNLYQYCGNNPVNWIDPWGLYTYTDNKLKDFWKMYWEDWDFLKSAYKTVAPGGEQIIENCEMADQERRRKNAAGLDIDKQIEILQGRKEKGGKVCENSGKFAEEVGKDLIDKATGKALGAASEVSEAIEKVKDAKDIYDNGKKIYDSGKKIKKEIEREGDED